MERREFNPFAYSMTAKAPAARSPSEFLAYDSHSREFWEFVDRVGAYEHHRVERKTHYVAFVDTLKLLQHPRIGCLLVEKLRDVIERRGVVPDIVLVPGWQRAQLLAGRLIRAFGELSPARRVGLITVRSRSGRWLLPRQLRSRIAGKSVLIIDSAVSHGRTLDELGLLALDCGAERVGGAFLLSRLTVSAEEAFRERLGAGFHRLYHLPVRPVLIHGDHPELCPVCQRKAAVTNAARDSRLEAIRNLASWLSQRHRRSGAPAVAPPRPDHLRQGSLFPLCDSAFLESCGSRVASGVTLHSLNAAMTNGMAPLSLPEVRNGRIPARNRIAMLDYLPAGVLDWSRGHLDRELEEILSRAENSGIWRASAGVLAREKHRQWMEHLGDLLERCQELRSQKRPSFWNSMVCNAYLAVHDEPQCKDDLRRSLGELLESHSHTTAAEGLRQMLDAIDV
jgi:hypothetical protein